MATQIYKSQYTGAQIDEAVKRVLNGEAGGGVSIETDPTVPNWAKQSSKPRYTASEVGAAPEQHSHKDYVKTVNGKAPDENGNVTVSGGGGGSGDPGEDGFSPIATVEQTDSGAVIRITDKSGTTAATVTNGKDGDSPELGIWATDDGYCLEITQKGATKTFPIYNGKDGQDGKDGISVTITDVVESTGSGAYNKVIFSDGNTLQIKNGSKGDKGDTGATGATGAAGKNGADGKTPVRGTDYWTTADQNAIIQQVIDALGGTPVFGVVDADNNIILSGNLAKGIYTLKYEDADGNVTEIGTIEVGGATYKNLAEPTSEDWAIDKRLNSSGVLADAPGCNTTNFFPCVKGDIIRVKGLDIRYTNSDQTQDARAWFFNATDDPSVGAYPGSDSKFVFDGVDMFTITLDGLTNISGGSEADVVKGRFSGMLFDGYTAEDVIITVNEEITE